MSADLVPFDVMHVVRLRGVLGHDAIVEILDAPAGEVDVVIAGLVDDGTMFLREGRRVSGFVLTEQGRDTHAALLAAQRDPALDHQLDQVYDAFLDHNPRVKTLCARWQQVGSDEAARWQAIGDLEDLHASADLVFVHAGELVRRFTRYSGRLQVAVDRVAAGDEPYFTSPLVDSYHTVWFEAHEDFIVTLGRDRAQEGSF